MTYSFMGHTCYAANMVFFGQIQYVVRTHTRQANDRMICESMLFAIKRIERRDPMLLLTITEDDIAIHGDDIGENKQDRRNVFAAMKKLFLSLIITHLNQPESPQC